jgi:hypothetical protein
LLADGDSYLLELMRYVHLNPIYLETSSFLSFFWSETGYFLGAGERGPVKIMDFDTI